MEKETRSKIISEYRINDRDTGSSSVQVAVLTERIREMTEHLKVHKKDNHSRHGLKAMVSLRRKHLNYLKRTDVPKYRELLEKLGIRR